jgi:hypothetical protein
MVQGNKDKEEYTNFTHFSKADLIIGIHLIEMPDKHDYIVIRTEGIAMTHAAGCRRCSPDPKSMICWKCKQRPENSLTLSR